ncbi:MAG TPA: hypothetical protein VJA26_02240 [Gammaproteobacteria bacterium]|nr:hypothetical protein [Gammaproteobacteria bacterium]
MPKTNEQIKTRGIRQVLSSVEDVRAAVVQVTGLANRALSILTHDLEPAIYDHDDFLETLKRFILARSFARVRVLIVDPNRVIKTGSRFVTMGRRLNSYIEFRNVRPEMRNHPEAFFIADEHALVFRARAESWEGMSDTYEPAVTRIYLNTFEELWNACEVDAAIRRLQL